MFKQKTSKGIHCDWLTIFVLFLLEGDSTYFFAPPPTILLDMGNALFV